MKKFNFTDSLWAVIVCLLFVACEGTFVPDPINPRLPKYTEDGNGVAGALVNNDIWKSQVEFFIYSYDEPYIIISPEQDNISIKFNGITNEDNASIKFDLTGLQITKFEDLLKLEGKKITLDESKNIGYYIFKKNIYTTKNIGQIYFKHTSIEESNGEKAIILSGTFGFTATNVDGKSIKITYGRFDYYINKSDVFIRNNTELPD